MKSFQIAWKDFLIQIRDRKTFLLMICMPLLLTAILGAALQDVFGSTESLSMKIGVLKPDNDSLADTLVNEVLNGVELKDSIEIVEVQSEEILEHMIVEEKVDVGMILPEKWSDGIEKGNLETVEILADPSKEIPSSVLSSIVTSFTERVNAISVSTKLVVSNLAMAQQVSTVNQDLDAIGTSVVTELQEKADLKSSMFVVKQPIGEKMVTSMQYYAAAMAAMFLLFNMTVGAKSIIKERSTETLSRLLSTPTSKQSILFGKFLGVFYFATMQFFLFIVVTYLGFNVYWGDNIIQLIFVGVSYSIAVSGLSMLFAAILKEEKTADTVGGMVVQVLSLLGGSMLPLAIFPDTLKMIATIAPNNWALTSLLEIMGGTTWESIYPAIGVLLGIGIVSVLIGSVRLQVK
ncbi:ABC transporter permease [Fredinandcohnia sp. 179-A 10B2 NHS]|uniref:ABC transporter permease n=1 Tax=Fredinandcohnia sp. 179-A 10B2 NHS TaxID=3235176 RepID=UPI0039A37FBD